MDIKSTYYNIEVEDSDQSNTAFVISTGKFEFKRLPFGLIGAPFTFAQAMTRVLQGFEEFVTSYFDDILVFSPSLEFHFKHLESSMKRLAEYRLPIKYSKCQFVKTEVKFIGHVINETRYKPEVTKISEIEFKRPSLVRKLRSFLGLTGFYQKFIPQYSKEIAPLSNRLKKNVKFEWSEDCESTQLESPEQSESSELPSYPDFSRLFICRLMSLILG